MNRFFPASNAVLDTTYDIYGEVIELQDACIYLMKNSCNIGA